MQSIKTATILEWLKSGTLTTPNSGVDVEKWDVSFIAGGNAKWHSHLKDSLAISYKNIQTDHMIQQSCSLVFIQKC